MTRAEAEKLITRKLREIWEIVKQCETNNGNLLCCSANDSVISAFQLSNEDYNDDLDAGRRDLYENHTIDVFELVE